MSSEETRTRVENSQVPFGNPPQIIKSIPEVSLKIVSRNVIEIRNPPRLPKSL